MAKLQRHVLICLNERAPGNPRGCCAASGSADVLQAFKSQLAERGLKRLLRATQTRCLDACDSGPAVVVYPDDVWYGRVTPADVPEIIERHLLGGEVVRRLALADDELPGIGRETRALPPLRDGGDPS